MADQQSQNTFADAPGAQQAQQRQSTLTKLNATATDTVLKYMRWFNSCNALIVIIAGVMSLLTITNFNLTSVCARARAFVPPSPAAARPPRPAAELAFGLVFAAAARRLLHLKSFSS